MARVNKRHDWPRPPDVGARAPSTDVAVALAKAIVVACKGYHFGISVLEAAGTPKLYYIPDGIRGHTHLHRLPQGQHGAGLQDAVGPGCRRGARRSSDRRH